MLVLSLGQKALKDELAELIISEWGVHFAFNIDDCNNSYKVIFKTKYDHGRALKLEWIWLRYNLLIIIPWQTGMSPPNEILDTVPV